MELHVQVPRWIWDQRCPSTNLLYSIPVAPGWGQELWGFRHGLQTAAEELVGMVSVAVGRPSIGTHLCCVSILCHVVHGAMWTRVREAFWHLVICHDEDHSSLWKGARSWLSWVLGWRVGSWFLVKDTILGGWEGISGKEHLLSWGNAMVPLGGLSTWLMWCVVRTGEWI